MKALVQKIVWPAYFAALAYFAFIGFNAYRDASFIMNDHTVYEASTELVDLSYRTKRGHTSITYKFNYTYIVNGETFTGRHSAVNEKGERYIENPLVTIAYSNADPSKVGLMHVLEGQASFWRLVKSMLIIIVVLGLVALFVYGWALPDEEDEEEEVVGLPEGAKN